MNILVVGSGAREHALGMELQKHSEDVQLYFAPGNGGTQEIGINVDIDVNDIKELVKFAKENDVEYTVVGPEDPLVAGIADAFEEEGLEIFAPGKEAAQLEGSKAYSKEFCVRHEIPTADYVVTKTIDDMREAAVKFLEKDGTVVLKADGLCAGKGVVLAKSAREIDTFAEDAFIHKKYGKEVVVVEEFLPGFEMSCLCFVDGETILPLSSSRDHKKIFDGEKGPNTGGMGTYSPNSQADVYLDEIDKKVLQPFLKGIQADGIDYRGLVFIGCMIGEKGVQVLEYNVRFGDPETQSVLHRLDVDLLDIMQATSRGKLSEMELKENKNKVITVVLASGGYPDSYEKGKEILGLDTIVDCSVYHAGTKYENGKYYTNGGRVLSLTATAPSFEEAKKIVYREIEKVKFEGMTYRKDIGPMVERVYVRKKEGFDNEAKKIKSDIENALHMSLEDVILYNRYDIEHLDVKFLPEVVGNILSEPPVDMAYYSEAALQLESKLENAVVVEYLPGQFDQRCQGMIDTIAVATGESVSGKYAKVYEFKGNLTKEQLAEVKGYLINPVDQQEGQLLGIPTTLDAEHRVNLENPIYEGFIEKNHDELQGFLVDMELAMSIEDLLCIQEYYKKIQRDPNEVELAILDTYWSDHCRHTTFNTELEIFDFEPKTDVDQKIKNALQDYKNLREEINRKKPVSLMDLGTIVSKGMRTKGKLQDLEVSEEVNACSVEVTAKIEEYETGNVIDEPYLFMFKNETHNHPTEIEPFGGASTCLGGAIRDPLSGRSYVYQAMRVTGAANPLEPVENTLEGKLAQKKITTEAAKGYSSYGNQIGLTSGLVEELYHPGYVAKRMEVGAVLGAAPRENVKRETPAPGDLVLLLGGRTGRDGVGGATGSSKEQDTLSIVESSAEVQKGNAPEERKMQRLFRTPEVAKMIKKCNDFGAGGVSVAIGELADSLEIYLDAVPLKYQGLTPKEIAISESQERMAVVIDPKDKETFFAACEIENLEVTVTAKVTDSGYMIMKMGDKEVAKLSREFLDSSGAPRYQKVAMESETKSKVLEKDIDNSPKSLKDRMNTLGMASQKTLQECFDASIGKNTIVSPYGGKNQTTPVRGMVAGLPSLRGRSQTASILTYGFHPQLSLESQFLGGYYAVVESLCNFVALGGDPLKARLSFQEYFQKLGEDEVIWSKPVKSLLGAFTVTQELEVPPIGGKDSMSGTFNDYHVPPTLISFAAGVEDIKNIVSPEFKGGAKLGVIEIEYQEDGTLDLEELQLIFKNLRKGIQTGNIISVAAVNHRGILPTAFEMSLGNEIPFTLDFNDLYSVKYGSFVVEYQQEEDFIIPVGETGVDKTMVNGEFVNMEEVKEGYFNKLLPLFPDETPYEREIATATEKAMEKRPSKSKHPVDVPKVIIPVFPGTNCEWDTLDAFEREGAKGEIFVFNNMSTEHIEDSIDGLAQLIRDAQILAIPGGFSLGDEPEGSAKFIANVLRNQKISEAIEYLLHEKDGLILGICNGFQALIKTGLLPFGKVQPLNETSPTIIYNNSGRHIARFVDTKAITTNSPWLQKVEMDKTYRLPISHGEGRFVCSEEMYHQLRDNDQLATIYEDVPNGSMYGIEGIISPDGKIFGKMGHSERVVEGRLMNIPGIEVQPIIASGVAFMKK